MLGIVDELERLATGDLYRKLRNVRVRGAKARINGKEVLLLCSNDYLGLSQNRQVVSSTSAAMRHGVSQCSSRLIAGNDDILEKFERELASHLKCRDTLVYPTGYMANIGLISCLAGRGDLIVSDELNHASIVDACRMSGADVNVFEHNDVGDMRKKLAMRGHRRKIAVTEGVFSMDGDLARLKEMGEVASRNDALLVLDDAHGHFVYGPHFRGTAEHLGAEKYVDIHVGSMSKALGCFGGFVASRRKEITDYLINRSRAFIYTSALPSAIAAGAMTAIKIARNGTLQNKLWKNVTRLRNGLVEAGFDIRSSSHIIPVVLGQEKLALKFSASLLKNGVFAQAIRYPTVPRGSARIRVSVTAMLEGHIDAAIEAFKRTATELGI